MNDKDRRPGKGRAVIGCTALAAGIMVSSGVWAAPAYATCSPQARPCITDVVMKDPTTLVFNWTDDWGKADGFQVRYHSTSDPDFLGLPGGSVIPENQFEAFGNSWEIRDVKPGDTYVLKVQACHRPIDMFSYSCHEWTEWDERTFTVPMPKDDHPRALGKVPLDDGDTSPVIEKQIDLPDFKAPTAPTATVAADVDVYNAKNEPDGAGHVVGFLRQGGTVTLMSDCAPESWCEVSGDAVPGGDGWVWGHLDLS
jgi:hypothetical protein